VTAPRRAAGQWITACPSGAEIRARFAKRHKGDERNRWLYSYNPLTVQPM
jgi:hypothetical protein